MGTIMGKVNGLDNLKKMLELTQEERVWESKSHEATFSTVYCNVHNTIY